MSGPYRYQPDASRSPLDRRPQMPLPAQPVSFKTNVNRAKTKKWVEAKKNAYDGDDWGDYDEYDEYGAADQELPPSARRNSFETGGEQRAFSASTGHPAPASPDQPHVHPALSQGSNAHVEGDVPLHQRSFSPSAMPPPLNTRMSPAPAVVAASPGLRFPPRKSSIGQVEASAVVSPRERAPSNPGKPLPFIRPADIYKRFEEEKKERDRVSLDGQRPGAEAISQQSLPDAQHSSPPIKENDPSLDSDLRSVVDHAFTRADDQRSVPPTPVTKSDASVSRSNTSSTSGISPIMSRVPSSTASAFKARNAIGGDGTTPVIAEETSESVTPVSRPTSAALLGGTHQTLPKASPNHSRNASGSSLSGSGLMTPPNATGSPARSPAITPQSRILEAERAEFFPPIHSSGEEETLVDATARESDIVEAMRTYPASALPELSVAEKESQTAFLETHQTSSPVVDTSPRSRSESPGKGRVQELAGKFGDVSHSRRGSTQSDASRTSVQSWEKSGGNSRPASPTKSASPSRDVLVTRPLAERESSFRPQLPGQWESYTTGAASPAKEHGTDNIVEENDKVLSPLDKVDLTPTTAKHSGISADPSKIDSSSPARPLTDPLAALKAAGAAVGEAFQSSVGLNSSPTDETHREQPHGNVLPRPLRSYRAESFASTIPPTPPPKDVTEFGEVPPPPPLKERGHEPQSSTVLPERPVMLPQLSTDLADDDQESDRLRKEIVASLSPQPTTTGSTAEQDPVALYVSRGEVNRESTLFPSEHDSYWADGDRTISRSSRDQIQNVKAQEGQSAGALPTSESLTQSPEGNMKPSILTRFSWEQGGGSALLLNKLQPPTIATSPQGIGRKDTEENLHTSTANERVADEQGTIGLSSPHSGSSPVLSAIERESTSAVNSSSHSPTADHTVSILAHSKPDPDLSPSPVTGLHVVNSALHPEAVDLPPRLSREVSPLSDHARSTEHVPPETPAAIAHDPAINSVSDPVVSDPPHVTGEAAIISSTVAASPTSDRPLGFRDILQFKTPSERISNYNKTRDYWAQADHGLSNWISTTLEKNPDLASQPYPQPPPHLNAAGTMRHKATGSISLFGKHHGSGSVQADSPSSSAQSPITPTSGTTFQGSGRSASHQMQAKGKDLLHTAGVLSGKGMTGAKGLFAKGKNRFKSEKATSEQGQSSREASEEPSDIGSAGPGTLAHVSLDTGDSPRKGREMGHIRRFSSPFRHSSRSRSRPISITLPSIESTPRSTPLHSRPQSYHPPETWNAGPSVSSGTSPMNDVGTSIPERVGVLPSPARSAFSWTGMEAQGQMLPVSSIPNDVDTTHRLLQSVVAASAPPAQQQRSLNVSPMIASAAFPSDVSVSSDDEQPTPVTLMQVSRGEDGFSYETELIGNDLSPIASHSSHNEEKTPTGIDAQSTSKVNHADTPSSVRIVETTLPGDLAARHAGAPEPAPRPKPQQQLSAYRVVRAVEYLHSQSSFESLEQESVAAASQSGRHDQHNDTELPPTHPSPDREHCELTIDRKADPLSSESDDKHTLVSMPDSESPTKSDTPQDGPQQSPKSARLPIHKRSESLISKISSMVSADDASISPVSSNCLPRSRPPSAQARWRQVPSAKTSPIPAQIQEEPNAPNRTINSALEGDDFDLYADHNGVVRDLHDEEGQPLRVLTDRPPQPAAASRPSATDASKYIALPMPLEDAAGRYSDERPMSFVWGPRDANGRPQDEINRPAGNPSLPLPNTRIQRSSQVLNGPSSYRKTRTSRGPSSMLLLGQPSHSDLGSKNVSPLSSHRESTKTSLNRTASPLPISDVSPSPRNASNSSSLDGPRSESPNLPYDHQEPDLLSKSPDPRLVQDPHAMMEAKVRERVPGQPLQQDSRSRSHFPGQTPHMPGNMLAAARNQYEFQQMLARQAMQIPETQSLASREQSAKKEDRSFKPKFSSVFKGLGKSSSNTTYIPRISLQPTPQQIQQPSNRSHPMTDQVISYGRRNSSHHLGRKDHNLSQTEHLKERRESGLESALNRPASMHQGSRSSQESTRVQVTDSRLDLGYQANASLTQSIPSLQSSRETFQHDLHSSVLPSYHASEFKVEDTGGKKKRFSALGNIFNRGVSSNGLPIKLKLNKGEKKAPKIRKQSGAVALQPVSQSRPWLSQDPTNLQRHNDTQHGPSLGAGRFLEGHGVQSQPVTLHAMTQQPARLSSLQHVQLQSTSPISQQGMPSHSVAERYIHSGQIQSQQGASEGSAYMDTRQFAQTHTQRMPEQSRSLTQQLPQRPQQDHRSTPPEFHSKRQYQENLASPSFNEFFKPDLKVIKPLPPTQPQHPPQDHHHRRRTHQGQTSSNSPAIDPFCHMPQRQVDMLPDEPKYETPPIPGAYAHVSGAFVSPRFEDTPSQFQSLQPSQQYHRHHSESQMPSIPPPMPVMPPSQPDTLFEARDPVIFPILNPSRAPSPAPLLLPNLNSQKSHTSHVTEQVQSERPWNLDLPQGATEQDIVRARQRQYMEQQLLAQEQLHAEKTGRSPSPRSRQSNQSASPPPPTEDRSSRQESGGFRELLPRSSPRPYPITSQQTVDRLHAPRPHSLNPPITPGPQAAFEQSPAAYPLPVSPEPALVISPLKATADVMPPPVIPEEPPQTPMATSLHTSQASRPISQGAASNNTRDSLYDPPPPGPVEQYQHSSHLQQPAYDDVPPVDELPPYSGPGLPNEGFEKERPRPPNIVTAASDHGRNSESRQRQASLGLLQHPQPASMAASPQRSSADMGADILRRQLLEAEERERHERLQRAEIQRQESARERKERERARARARELERSVSGGGRVGSLRIAEGSTRANANGFERSVSTTRPVYELPAEEDDEPVMRATSFPGQEWVPTWTED